jgi:hypothetical protein
VAGTAVAAAVDIAVAHAHVERAIHTHHAFIGR